ncbi:CbiX/SirB N-terminal domain-containing protein [Candidatus Mycalebacterium sp.]
MNQNQPGCESEKITPRTEGGGILICGHGSRDPEGVEGFKSLVRRMKSRQPGTDVDYGFLEFSQPTFDVAVKAMVERGVKDIISLPAILFAGGHAKNDMPFEMNSIQAAHKGLKIRFGSFLGVSPQLLELCRLLIEKSEKSMPPRAREDTCLLLVGRGTSDPDGNSDVAKMARMLEEGMGFGFSRVAYIGVTKPGLEETLKVLENLPYSRIVAVPVFLFTGVLLKRIYAELEKHRAVSRKEILHTEPFGAHDLILDILDERVEEVEQGNANMNCQLCKYRTQVVGFENEVGREQVGHHFHVRGISSESGLKSVNSRKIGRLRGISLGPGAPDLITVRALEALRGSDRIYYPSAKGASGSRCVSILRHYGLQESSKPIAVDMKTRSSADSSYRLARGVLLEDLKQGLDVAVVCEGCLSLYSTVFRILCDDVFGGDFELIPGVSSPSAAAASADVCLGLGSDRIAMLPGGCSEREMEDAIGGFETVVIMKPPRAGGLVKLIREKGLGFVYCRDIGGENQFITSKPAEIEDGDLPYFSLFIISKRFDGCRVA